MVTEAKPQTDGAQTQPSVQTSPSDGAKGAPAITQEHVAKMVNDALAKAGRDAKTLGDREARIKADAAKFADERTAWERQRDADEQERLKDNPDAFASLRQKRELDRRAAELQRKEEEIAAKEAAALERERVQTESVRERLANTIASELNVDPASLLKFTDGSETAMRELAAQLPKRSPPADGVKPDSGATAGGVGVTSDNIDALHLQGKVSDQAYRTFLRTGQL